MAPFCPHHTAATRRPSHPNVTIDAIHKTKEAEFNNVLRAHIHAIRLSVHSAQMDVIAMHPASSSLPASITDTLTPANSPATVSEDAAFDDTSSDEETVWNKVVECAPTSEDGGLSQFLEDNAATHQASLEDQIAHLGSQESYWNPWESELLQDEFWDSVGL